MSGRFILDFVDIKGRRIPLAQHKLTRRSRLFIGVSPEKNVIKRLTAIEPLGQPTQMVSHHFAIIFEDNLIYLKFFSRFALKIYQTFFLTIALAWYRLQCVSLLNHFTILHWLQVHVFMSYHCIKAYPPFFTRVAGGKVLIFFKRLGTS
jgi:hypothetical protein